MTAPALHPPTTDHDARGLAALERTDRGRTGLWGWLAAVDHKTIATISATAFASR